MSQAKVDKYKEEKANRKQIIARERRKKILTTACGCVIAVAIVGWAGYSIYSSYEKSKPTETVYTDLTAVEDYLNALNDNTEE